VVNRHRPTATSRPTASRCWLGPWLAHATALQWAQELFAAATVVLAHDGADPGGDPGPRLTYANRAALQLWRRPWAELVGMPSRLTAEPAERAGRAQALASVQRQRAISGYSGMRIDSRGAPLPDPAMPASGACRDQAINRAARPPPSALGTGSE
jgi:hypothetical protein